ncbi:oxygenase MpaB family protein [Candidatus Entotheonella palauensis]|uniref:oxygenase MpaB family protein n=1 Tax=Candidatus Entotheonella palauensis TaxID=93172 RepID=UPI0015C4A19D|nr:oxygenase MpaB family protein [Candidatus Entotheonella palauensis]
MSVQKLRVHHCFVRWTVLNSPALPPWQPEEWGQPINQEDEILAILALSLFCFDGMDILDVPMTQRHREDALMLWLVFAHLLGVDDKLIPRSLAEAEDLLHIIGARQFRASEHGTDLVREILGIVQGVLPPELKPIPVAMFRYLMDRHFTQLLKVPPVVPPRAVTNVVDFFVDNPELEHLLTGHFLRSLVEGFRDAPDRHGERTPFEIPSGMRFSFLHDAAE